MVMEKIFKCTKTQTVENGRRFGLGNTAVFKVTDHLDRRLYFYTTYMNNQVYISGPEYVFKKFDEDSPIYAYGINTEAYAPKVAEVTIRVDKVYTNDNGMTFTIEYTVMY